MGRWILWRASCGPKLGSVCQVKCKLGTRALSRRRRRMKKREETHLRKEKQKGGRVCIDGNAANISQ